MSANDHNWLRRFRSSSVSSDLDVDEVGIKEFQFKTPLEPRGNGSLKGGIRTRASTTNISTCYQRSSPEQFLASLASGHDLLKKEPNLFPFSSLTEDCKLHIFGYLSPPERGKAARVCHEWARLMRSPCLWSVIDLVVFPQCPTGSGESASMEDSLRIYEVYRARMKRYMAYLIKVSPMVKVFRFELDIGDVRDGWLDIVQALLRASQLHELEHAELGWTETPPKPYVPDNSSATWCANDCKDLMYRHRHRQRLFVKFFDLFTAIARNVVSLTLPFDWTERSLCALRRLPNLEVLNLQKYFVFQPIEQTLIDNLLSSGPLLRHLTVEIWTPSGRGLQKFQIRSETLEFLDISRCRGFYVDEVAVPALKEFHVSVCPMNGPLVSGEGVDVKCLYTTLQKGAPNLQIINELILKPDWTQCCYDELETLLKSICACTVHQSE